MYLFYVVMMPICPIISNGGQHFDRWFLCTGGTMLVDFYRSWLGGSPLWIFVYCPQCMDVVEFELRVIFTPDSHPFVRYGCQ